MLLVNATVGLSKVHGFGLIAQEFIPKGTMTWRYDPEFDSAFEESALDRMPGHGRVLFLHYAYFDYNLKKFVLCADDQRFINHSDRPNIHSVPEKDIAARDIHAGEEMLCNYTHYDRGWFERRGLATGEFK